MDDKMFYRCVLSYYLFKDLNRALCDPILEQIEEMIIPISDVDRYINILPRFKALTHVTFRLDMIPDANGENWPGLRSPPDAGGSMIFEEMIEFVWQHTRLFRNQLDTVQCLDGFNVWPHGLKVQQRQAAPGFVSHKALMVRERAEDQSADPHRSINSVHF
ncbi:hypothetical protein BG011_010063 [Mortierella polycephala]|uniref:Uncharacterized protein n=1 Tax=Mortierella polycephala TaxID=41804 RepID=A0A9P6U799_9FUNG|nr:hypothetical protein BG011_010063 [Mortierella polycephala]